MNRFFKITISAIVALIVSLPSTFAQLPREIQPSGPEADPGFYKSPWLWLAIAVVVLLIILFYAAKKRADKKKKEELKNGE